MKSRVFGDKTGDTDHASVKRGKNQYREIRFRIVEGYAGAVRIDLGANNGKVGERRWLGKRDSNHNTASYAWLQ